MAAIESEATGICDGPFVVSGVGSGTVNVDTEEKPGVEAFRIHTRLYILYLCGFQCVIVQYGLILTNFELTGTHSTTYLWVQLGQE